MGPGGTIEKKNNVLPLWGNEKTMNLNNMILTNILSSHYFKVNLYQLKTYHEVVDEIYYQVRGVGAGGIVSTAFCILYKLFTLKLTRKQLIGLITHRDSPHIRGLGFMYIRYTQPPADLWEWFEPYLDDEEELDVKAGGGQVMSIGEILRHMLSKLEWFSTLFPRIPVPIQKDLERKLSTLQPLTKVQGQGLEEEEEAYEENEEEPEVDFKKREELPWAGSGSSRSRDKDESSKYRGERIERKDSREHYRRSSSPSHSRHHRHHRSRSRTKSNSERDRSASRDKRHHHDRDRHHDRHHSHRSSRRHSPSRHHHRSSHH